LTFWGKEKGMVPAVSSYRGFTWDHMRYGRDHDKMVTLMDKVRTSWAWRIGYASELTGSHGWRRGKGFWDNDHQDFIGQVFQHMGEMGLAPSCIKVLL